MSDVVDLEALSRRARWLTFSTIASSGAGHIGGPLSAMDLLVVLFFGTLNIRPEDPTWSGRDHFILSKGHSSIALYTVMALRGYFDVSELATFDHGDSRLQGHPDMTRLPGLDASTGSLGQGLSVGVGYAIGARLAGKPNHTWVMLGDGEMQEGMVWEAINVAARYELTNLTAIVDCNGLQQYGWPRGDAPARGDRRDPWPDSNLAQIFEAFGWEAIEFDGHDFAEIERAYAFAREASGGRPVALLARTMKGRGISFTEGAYKWHSAVPAGDELELARLELGIEDGRPL